MKMNGLVGISVVGLVLAIGSGTASANTAAFDKSMAPIVEQYAKVHDALASDKTTGVAAAAKAIAKLSKKLDPKSVTGMHAKHYKGLPSKIKSAAGTLAKAKDIAKAREAFKALSRPLAMWAEMSKPEGVKVVFCSMAKASWLQRDAKVRNPYYGAKMLDCGQIVAGKAKSMAGGHMKHHH